MRSGTSTIDALRWLILTDDDLDLHGPGARRRLLWQILNRFDVERDLRFDDARERVAWERDHTDSKPRGPLLSDVGLQ